MENEKTETKEADKPVKNTVKKPEKEKLEEVGGRGGLDPSRFGDWEIGGKCIDF